MRITTRDGVEIVVHELGGSGELLLISHATGFCGPMYEPLATSGLTERYRVVAIDHRGHGASGAPPLDRFDWTHFVDDTLAVIDALGGGPVRLFGHSMGGAVGLWAEQRRPGTLSAAYVFEPITPPAGEMPGGANFMSEAARRRRPSFGSRAEVIERYASRPPLSSLRADVLYAYATHGFHDTDDGSVTLACSPEHEAATFEGTKPTIEQLAGVSIPVTVARGFEAGETDPSRYSDLLAGALSAGRLLVYDYLSHFGPFEDPRTVAAHVLDALDQS